VFGDLLSVTQHLSLQLHATQLDIGACRRVSKRVKEIINDKRLQIMVLNKSGMIDAVTFANGN